MTGLVVECGPCGTLVDVRQPDTDGHLRTPPWFIQLKEAPYTVKPAELMNWVRLHVRYVRDGRFHRFPEAWQRAAETYEWRHGDCEDSAILLADWLRAIGHETYVVAGKWRQTSHVWVVLRDAGEWYILETTASKAPGRRNLPLASLLTDYNPTEFMFDDKQVWARRTTGWTADYESPQHWYRLQPGD